MKKKIAFLLFLGSATFGFSDDGDLDLGSSDSASAQKQAVQMQLEQLVQLDKQIEGLEQQKAKLKGEMAEHMEKGTVGLLPRGGRRQDRAASEDMQSIQQLNQQIENLESERQNVLRQLK